MCKWNLTPLEHKGCFKWNGCHFFSPQMEKPQFLLKYSWWRISASKLLEGRFQKALRWFMLVLQEPPCSLGKEPKQNPKNQTSNIPSCRNKKRPPLYLGWVFGSFLKVLMGMLIWLLLIFKKKKWTNAVSFEEPVTDISLPQSCVEQFVVRMGKEDEPNICESCKHSESLGCWVSSDKKKKWNSSLIFV